MAQLVADETQGLTGEWGIRFCTPDAVTDVGARELKHLLAELGKIADGTPRLAAAAELAERLDSLTGPLGSVTAFAPQSLERFALLRALDHLRNLGHRGDLMTLRERILLTSGIEPITYQLRVRLEASPIAFWSFSREYELGDRIVRNPAEEFRVVEVEAGSPVVLFVDCWRTAA